MTDTLSYLSNAEIGFLDGLYADYQQNPATISPEWKSFFDGFTFARNNYEAGAAVGESPEHIQKELSVLNLINAYRSRGHLFAQTNPILPSRAFQPTLDIENFGLRETDLDTVFASATEIGIGPAPLRKVIDHLKTTYCGTIGVEYKYIRNPDITGWLESHMEPGRNQPNFSKEEKHIILEKLGQSTTFEQFLHRKFVGQKRFSLEGAESVIPALDAIIESGADQGIREFVLGMAHRGRLNVLTNIMRKEYDSVFGEFEGKGLSDNVFDGDVKYHMGFSSDIVSRGGHKVHLSLLPNPSHLETVDPVVIGTARAKMDNIYEDDHNRICPILIHGDASLAGQGVVYEVIQMSQLDGYEVGGTIHIVLNNQIGFTTNARDARSSTYCTDVAKVTLSPVFHVNGDDPEAFFHVAKIAMAFRQKFHRDVFIDVVCYRKYGHNEGDEPRFTQPLMYDAISKHASPFEVYAAKLKKENTIDDAHVSALNKKLSDNLDKEWEESRVHEYKISNKPTRMWDGLEFYDDHKLEANPKTTITKKMLQDIGKSITTLPQDFTPHRNIVNLLKLRAEMAGSGKNIDWGMAEHLAYGSILLDKRDVRISGQDVRRGTFSHRHAVLFDQTKDIVEGAYEPLNYLADKQGRLMIYNSLLSEYAVLGFDAGYAMAAPRSLTIWEAQFGDFVNGAQIIIDQFLSASKTKWQRLCGLVLLLPHGFEGQGPEHSSARLERFLILCAENNMFVCNFTTPANLFHALRRQVLSNTRRPLVVFTPKSLLRHPLCVSELSDFTEKGLREVIDDHNPDPKSVKRVVFVTGKLYYDLWQQQKAYNLKDVAVVRLEQIYPLPLDAIEAVKAKYKGAKEFIWAQEEPENMGAWPFISRKLRTIPFEVVARKESASPATGTPSQHTTQQHYIIRKSLNLAPDAEIK
ncbi:MAG: 2-oxoglutarate dehydrogenase E1 component [Bacteroidetes bacterium]|nr:2-oxoglutarate dehydrogenase E1 component [Bacteroidota bacterium]